MPRLPRLHVPGGCYHVMLRGNHQEALFETTEDRHVLNGIVAAVVARLGARVHAFCWMSNHLHMLVQIADKPLGAVMQRIAVRYSRYRHRAMGTSGHLFERRYRAKIVDVDEYLLALLRYIHLNPVKAGIVTDPVDYPWSSHRAYLGREWLTWLTTDLGLSLLSADPRKARRAYNRFLAAGDDQDDLELAAHPRDSRILGGDRFLQALPRPICRPRSRLTLAQLLERVCDQHHVDPALLRSPSRTRRLALPRVQFATQAVELRIATLAEAARFLRRDPAGLARLVERHEKRRGD